MPDNDQWASFYRLENEYLIRFFDLADFYLSRNGVDISVYPVPDISDQTVEHLYLNLIIPLALSCQSKLVLHGSAVEIDDFAVAFLGNTGAGKSTLAASFSTNGNNFLTDDCLQLDNIDSQYFIQPSHPSIRLWDDSQKILIPDTTDSAPPIDYTPKARLLANEKVAFCDEARPLRYIYFLGEGNSDVVSINPIMGCESIIELEKHSFLLDMEDKQMLKHHFEQITSLAKHPIFFRLDYPRYYETLPDVRESVIKHTREIV